MDQCQLQIKELLAGLIRGIIVEQFGSVEVSTQLTSIIYGSVIGILHLKTDIKNPCLFPIESFDVATVGYTFNFWTVVP